MGCPGPREMEQSPSLELFRNHGDVALRGVVSWHGWGGLGLQKPLCICTHKTKRDAGSMRRKLQTFLLYWERDFLEFLMLMGLIQKCFSLLLRNVFLLK